MAGERHGNGMLCMNRPLRGIRSLHRDKSVANPNISRLSFISFVSHSKNSPLSIPLLTGFTNSFVSRHGNWICILRGIENTKQKDFFSLYGEIRLHNLAGMKQMNALIDVTQAATVTYSTTSAFDHLLNCNILIYFLCRSRCLRTYITEL